MKTVILGTGSWGTALGQVLADNGNEVVMYGIESSEVEDLNQNHRNSRYFDAQVNEAIHATMDIQCVEDADVVLLAVPVVAIESMARKVSELIKKPAIIVTVAKGFHPVTHERMSVVIEKEVNKGRKLPVVSLIGPSHAEEVILRKLTAVNAVCADDGAAKTIQELFSNDYFRVYRNNDVIGAEIGVAIKNVIAIASGILHGIGQGDNARAALMTRGLAEITRFGVAMGGKKETYLGLDGVGDLIVTCSSRHSRNFMAGYQIGKDGGAERFLRENNKTVEGVLACKVVYEEARKNGIDMPITEQVYKILYENESPQAAIVSLMRRDLKPES